jgi:glycosyltransferase involved in cell wall biosynthesis
MTLGGIQRKVIDIIKYTQINYPNVELILCLQNKKGIFLNQVPSKITTISPSFHTRRFDKLWFTFWLMIQIIKHNPTNILSFMDLSSIPILIALKFVFWKKPKVIIGEDILTSKYVYIETHPQLRLKLIKYFYPKANSILVQTPVQKKDLNTIINNYKDNNIFVSPNWLPLDFPPKNIKKIINKRPIDILFIGRIEAQKNLIKFIKIIKNVSKYNPKIKVTIIGSGSELSKIKRQINKLDLQKNIKILPPTINPAKFYLKAKIFLLTSDYEGFPLTLLEAISCGCTPVVNNIPEVQKFFDKYSEEILFTDELNATQLISTKLLSVNQDINHYYQEKIIKLQQKNITKFVKHLF